MLIESCGYELVEATPLRLWGCGATMSSNLLRRKKDWPGENRHGQILMTVRDEIQMMHIREIPDHATFREKEHKLGWLDKLGGFLSLALCNLANFDHLYFTKYIHYHFT